MILEFQNKTIEQLKLASKLKNQSIIITGNEGTGKTFLAKMYANLIECENFITLKSSINDIREAIDQVFDIKDDVVICFENLDQAMLSSSYALLKFLEEPKSNVYVIITCRNLHHLPDTILSRSNVIEIGRPTKDDVEIYARNIDSTKYNLLHSRPIWKGATSLSYVKKILEMTEDEIQHYERCEKLLKSNKPISTILWELSHFKHNNQLCDTAFAVNYIIQTTGDLRIKMYAINYIDNLQKLNIAPHIILANFILHCKYTQ